VRHLLRTGAGAAPHDDDGRKETAVGRRTTEWTKWIEWTRWTGWTGWTGWTRRRWSAVRAGAGRDAGMSTAEYAMGTTII
jgi:hypothetical protein